MCNSTACPWLETTLYGFIGGLDGGEPQGNLLFNAAGDIYGTTEEGTAYVLTPLTHSWIYRLISDLRGHSYAGLISDATGNLFGTTYDGGGGLCYRGISCGTVFELTPVGSSWHLNVLHSFQGNNDGGFPTGALISDRLVTFMAPITPAPSSCYLQAAASGPSTFSINSKVSVRPCRGRHAVHGAH